MNNLMILIIPNITPISIDAPSGFSFSMSTKCGRNIRFAANAIGHPLSEENDAFDSMYLIDFNLIPHCLIHIFLLVYVQFHLMSLVSYLGI